MKKIKSIVCAVLILALCFGGNELSSLCRAAGLIHAGGMTAYAGSGAPAAVKASPSFVPSDRTDIEFYEYYTEIENNKAQYKDRNGEMQYRIYGTPKNGTEGWYVADKNFKPVKPVTAVIKNTEFMQSAPVKYSIYGPDDQETKDSMELFFDAHPEFRNGQEAELAEPYEMVWDDSYDEPYRKKDTEDVYGTKGAFILKQKTETAAIYYVAYGKIENNVTAGTDQWFLFEENTGCRYMYTYTAGLFTGTMIGAVEELSGQIEAPASFAGYQKPDPHTLENNQSGNYSDTWAFTYTANTSVLNTYSYGETGPLAAVKMADLVYDKPASATVQASHRGYKLKYYCYPKTTAPE